MHTAILVSHIAHYHDARFRAYSERVEALTVISATGEACFAEFLAKKDPNCPYASRTLFADNHSYSRARSRNRLWSKVAQVLDELEPDVVVIPGWAAPEGLAALTWARRHRRGLVILSESQEADAVRSPTREFVKHRIVNACDSAFVGGRLHRDYIVRLGMPAESVFLGYDAIDNTYFKNGADTARVKEVELRNRLDLPGKYILASGRFIPKKNFGTVIKAYAHYAANGIASHDLVILGDGPERCRLEDLVDELGVRSRVHMPGFRSYDLLPIYYGLASFFVHVSTVEQWGLVVNEAMAAGLPIVVSRSCGSAHELVIDGRNGYIVDPLDEHMLSERIRTLAACEQYRRQMGEAARLAVASCGPENFAEGLFRATKVALGNKGKRALSLLDTLLFKSLARVKLVAVA
jgi:glycosyltransferase involved in cell wall biosynthesis